MADFTSITSTREGYSSVNEGVESTVSSTREGYASAGELLAYGQVFHERTAYVSVTEAVAVTAISTREGYASVPELLGYGAVFHDRTGYSSLVTAVTYREPDMEEVGQPFLGWGVPLLPPLVLIVFKGSADATASVIEQVEIVAEPLNNREATATASQLVVS